MKRHFGLTKEQRRAEWLSQFSDAVVTAEPKYAGHIDWDSALHLFFQGIAPQDAARTYINNRRQA